MNKVIVELTEDDAKLFIEFQKHYTLIGYVLGVMSGLNLTELKTCELTMHFNASGAVTNAQITKHFRELYTGLH